MNMFPRTLGRATAVGGALRPIIKTEVAGEKFSGLEYNASSPDVAAKLMLTVEVVREGRTNASEGVRANAVSLLPLTRFADFLGASGQLGVDVIEAIKLAVTDVVNVTGAELATIPTEHSAFLQHVGTFEPGSDEKVRITVEPAVDLAVGEWYELALGDPDPDEVEAQFSISRVDDNVFSGSQFVAVFLCRNRLDTAAGEVNDDMETHTKEQLWLTYQRGRDFQRSNFLRDIATRNRVQGWYESGKLDNGAILLDYSKAPSDALDEVLFRKAGSLASKYHFLVIRRFTAEGQRATEKRAGVALELQAKLAQLRDSRPSEYAALRAAHGLIAPEEVEVYK